MAALTYSAEIFANNKCDRMKAAGSVSSCNPPLVSLCCHRLSEAAESAGLTWLSFGTDGWTVDLVNTSNLTQRATLLYRKAGQERKNGRRFIFLIFFFTLL